MAWRTGWLTTWLSGHPGGVSGGEKIPKAAVEARRGSAGAPNQGCSRGHVVWGARTIPLNNVCHPCLRWRHGQWAWPRNCPFPVPRFIGGQFSFYIERGQSFRTNTCSNRQPAVLLGCQWPEWGSGAREGARGEFESQSSHQQLSVLGQSRALCLSFLVCSLGSEVLPR